MRGICGGFIQKKEFGRRLDERLSEGPECRKSLSAAGLPAVELDGNLRGCYSPSPQSTVAPSQI
jgi:hypothetical protein